jgi:hypothetical protein
MNRWHVALISGVLLATLCWAQSAMAEDTVSPQQAAQVVTVTGLNVRNGAVTGTLANGSPHEIRDVRLLIRHAWVWKDERHPGTDNPGTSEYYTAPGTIAPGQSLRFTHAPSPPLPERSDGHFDTSVQVVGFEEVGK